MESLIILGLIVVAFGFGYHFGEKEKTSRKAAQSVDSKSDTKEKSDKVADAEKLRKETLERLEQRFKADAERYVVEIDTKEGKSYRTEVFVPTFSAYSNYNSFNCYSFKYIDETYNSSKQLAEQFVRENQHEHSPQLVRFGDEYICKKTITKVRLVKINEEIK